MNRFGMATRLALPLMAAGLLATACGSSGGSGSGAAGAGGGGGAGASTGSGGSLSAATIKSASGSVGTYLTDGSGRALYLWMADSNNKSACSGACAGLWPPLTASGTPKAASGVQASDLGTITRSDGAKQVTYDGHPLYYYAGDSGSGDTNGQGSNGFGAKWWLVAPSGSAITGAPAASTSAPSYNY